MSDQDFQQPRRDSRGLKKKKRRIAKGFGQNWRRWKSGLTGGNTFLSPVDIAFQTIITYSEKKETENTGFLN